MQKTKYQTNDKVILTESDKDYTAFKNKLYVECLLSIDVLNANYIVWRQNTQPRMIGSYDLPTLQRR